MKSPLDVLMDQIYEYNVGLEEPTEQLPQGAVKLETEPRDCDHNFVAYYGFTHAFYYCTKCDKKKELD